MEIADLDLEPKCGRTWVRYFKNNEKNMIRDFIDEKKILKNFIKKNLIDYCLKEKHK